MSLFPAYAAQDSGSSKGEASTWTENQSFAIPKEQVEILQKASVDSDTLSSVSSSSDVEVSEIPIETRTVRDFDGKEEYHVDKKPALQYKNINTLHRPACPKYRTHFRGKLGWERWIRRTITDDHGKRKRYYQRPIEKGHESNICLALDENEYTKRLAAMNRKTLEAPTELSTWLNLIELQEQNPYKWSRLMLAEKKLDLIQRALVYHQRNEVLYRQYIDIVSRTYPSFEASKLLDSLLAKDPYSYILWTAQIMTTQGTMARCIVPDVLHIYERCMQKMHHAQTKALPRSDDQLDDIMLRLFHNCALFLRQAGLYEQFFALIKLALRLNVASDEINEFEPAESDEQTLVEYEEIILQSGLPMNEIWLRIEKLRQSFHFLPCPVNKKVNDPQRIVFNEDVCHYIYPLKSREKSFFLMLQVLHLLKLPFIQTDNLAEKFAARVESIGDSDAIEDMLVICIRRTFALNQQQHQQFLDSIYKLTREMAVTPTFLNHTIGHEIYANCIKKLLMNCAASYEGIDARKRMIFLLLWCRFERILLIQQKCNNSLSDTYTKEARARFKALLKQKDNQNMLNLYTEFALYEYEALQASDALDGVQKIFENLISLHQTDTNTISDICYTYATYAEILIERGRLDEALQVLASYAFGRNVKEKRTMSAAQYLIALQKVAEKLDNLIAIEKNVEIMVLEQYLLPDHTVAMLKVHALLQNLVGQKVEALAYLDKMLGVFRKTNDRHSFLREHILELVLTIMQMPSPSCLVTDKLYSQRTFSALQEYPRNVFIIQQCCMLRSTPWWKIRNAILSSNPTVQSITFLVALTRYRFVQELAMPTNASDALISFDRKFKEAIVRNRISNLFKSLVTIAYDGRHTYAALQRNGLFWRFHLRFMSDQSTSFEDSKRCLLTALDECPWNKSLYLDGATYVPQELPHLQDLIIEKQLRIYALPEELEILRGS